MNVKPNTRHLPLNRGHNSSLPARARLEWWQALLLCVAGVLTLLGGA